MATIPEFHKSRCQKCKNGEPTTDIDWSWIDQVYCISLKDREDRAKEAELEFHKVGLCHKVVFYRPTKDKSDYKRPGSRGCWNSHHNLAKKVHNSGAKMAMIYEDDVKFDEKTTTQKSVQRLAHLTKKKKNWNLIYLGQWSMFTLPTRFFNLHRSCAIAAHAYLISNKALKWLAKTEYDDGMWLHKNKSFIGFNIDVFYMFTPRAYAYFPSMAYQSGSKSSNQRPNIIGAIIFNFGLSDPRYMKYNQYLIFILSLVLMSVVLLQLGRLILNIV